MRLGLLLALLASPAAAHPGHLGQAAGHDHRIAGAALGAAAIVALWAAWKGLRAAGPDARRGEDDPA